MPTDQDFLARLTNRPIGSDLDLSRFRCDPVIDDFLRELASRFHDKRISTVNCWILGEDLVGYVTTSMTLLEIKGAEDRQSLDLDALVYRKGGGYAKSFPAILIGMLGTCSRYVRRGVALHLIKTVIGLGYELCEQVGCRFVVVDSALTTEATSLYEKAGFVTARWQDANRRTRLMYFDLGVRSLPK